jgi:mannose-6-phosphate isomerase-like protein (cupin superfamily)
MNDFSSTALAPAYETPIPLPAIARGAVTEIGPADRAQRPCRFGFVREVCVDDPQTFVCFAMTEPGSATPWHDHGDSTTYALLLQGEAAVEFGDNERLDLRADGTVYVIPPHLSHREINTGSTKNQIMVLRAKRPRGA